MPAFFREYEEFRGTGERNEQGETLDAFLEAYDPYRYKNPCATTDTVVFTYEKEPVRDSVWRVLLIQRRNHPSIGLWALPGGFVELREDLIETARRELAEETGVEGLALEQIGVYGKVRRDPRARVISTAYLAVTEAGTVRAAAGDDAKDARWFRIRVEEEEGEGGARLFHLFLRDEAGEVKLRADLELRVRGGFVREEDIRTLSKEGIAGDHAEILLGAWRKLSERLS